MAVLSATLECLDPRDISKQVLQRLQTRWLSAEERQQAAAFRFETNWRAYVTAHALLRALLSQRFGGTPEQWQFGREEHGKPFLLNPPSGMQPSFSLSHACGMVVAAVADHGRFGIDVEPAQRDSALDLGVSDRFFAPKEAHDLRQMPPERQQDNFLRIWTLKEAVVKATGEGLTRSLKSFCVSLDPLAIEDHSEGPSWRVRHWLYRDHHFAAACRMEGDVEFTLRDAPLSIFNAS